MPIPDNIEKEISTLQNDVKAEVIVCQLLSEGMLWNEMQVHVSQFFYRRFSRDIFKVEIDENSAFNKVLHIHTSRPGLYDNLPEGLFFQQDKNAGKPMSVTEMAEDYRINKKQESGIRKFFSPLENEFVFQRYKAFKEEKALLGGLDNQQLNKYFKQFWQLPDEMPSIMALRLTLLLPYVHQVAGDAALMGDCMENILGENVSCQLIRKAAQVPPQNHNLLGEFSLGNDFVCGCAYEEDEPCFLFNISELKQSAIQDYLPGGSLYLVLLTFYRFFVPVAAAVETSVLVKKANGSMQIGNMEEATLGFASVI